MKKIVLSILVSLVMVNLLSQSSLKLPRNIENAYKNGTRDVTGMPGDNYWQNHASYDIRVSFDPSGLNISGSETIIYKNQSPDTLKQIVFKVFPNLYSKGAPRLEGINPADVSDGVQINNFKIDGATVKFRDAGTNMFVPKEVSPGQTINISLEFSYKLNKGSFIRTGESDDNAWFVAYFFPRVAVYDDIDGWDLSPYLGNVEFYNDFSDFRLAVTVPKDDIVWATGTLKNPAEVLSPMYFKRLMTAEKSDKVITIIDSTDIENGNITVDKPYNTFLFESDNITDVAFAVSNRYMWKSASVLVDSTTGRRTRVDAIFSESRKDLIDVIDIARKTVELMSYYFPQWPFPYQHETVFHTSKAGSSAMEYPMMVALGNARSRDFKTLAVSHEIFHTMFPFYTGLNETKYAWMDEGLTSLGHYILLKRIESSLKDVTFPISMKNYINMAGKETDVPVINLSSQTAYESNSIYKSLLALLYLRDMIGEDLFLKGINHFIRTWNGKHPMFFDFFNCMNRGTDIDLNWYWQKWFIERGIPDLAIAGFEKGNYTNKIFIEMKGELPVPIELTILYKDGSREFLHRTAAVWEKGSTKVEINLANKKEIKEITLGSEIIPDLNPKDNYLVVK